MEINELSHGQREEGTGEQRRERVCKRERERKRGRYAASAKAVLVTDYPLGVDGRAVFNQGQVGRLGPDTGNCGGEAASNKSPIPGQHRASEQGTTKETCTDGQRQGGFTAVYIIPKDSLRWFYFSYVSYRSQN